jgi:tetratricopeptide (TPR) repeat protein
MQAFPAEPYFPLLGAHSALLAGADAIPWINQTLRRSPESALAHIELAAILQARGATDQALVTLRRAAELDPAQARAVLNLGLSWGLEPERLLRAVPDGPVSSRMLVHLAQQSRDPEQSIRWLKEAETRDSRSAPVQQELAELLYRDLSSKDGVVCRNDRESCLNMAEQYVARGYSPEVPRRRVLTALLLAERGQTGEAETQLEATCRDLPEDLPCAEAFVKLTLANQSPRLLAATKRLVAVGCRTTERCAETHLRLGDLLGGRGEWRLALMHYRLATQEVSSPRAWQAVAVASERLRQPGLAAEARRRAHLLSGGGTANK